MLIRQSHPRSWIKLIPFYAVLCGLGAFPAWFWMFRGIDGWDDVGFLLMTVRQFLDGRRLFDEIYTQYGTGYYAVRWMIHGLLGVELSHAGVRWVSLCFWVATAMLCSWTVLRFTRSFPFSVFTFALAIISLRSLRNEPGHPQETGIFLVMAVVFAATWIEERPRGALAAMATLATFAALIKINLGGLIGFGAIGAFLPYTEIRNRRALSAVWIVLSLAFPWLLISAHWHDRWALVFAAIATASLASLFAWYRRPVLPLLRATDWGIAAGCSALLAGIVIAIFLWNGSSPGAILDNMVLMHLHFASIWYTPAPFSSWLPAALAALGCALAVWLDRPAWVDALKLFYGVGMVVCAAAHLPQTIFRYGPALLWLAAIPSARSVELRQTASRALLAFLAAFLMLYAYPVAGDQVEFAAILPIIAGVICLHDGFTAALAAMNWEFRGQAAVVCAIMIALAWKGLAVRAIYLADVPLALPGTDHIRVAPEVAAELHAITARINAGCRGFTTMPGMASLHFWTGQPPFSTINAATGRP
jgi:hypothetical protein